MPLPTDSLLELSKLRDVNQLAQRMLDEKKGDVCFSDSNVGSATTTSVESLSADIWGAQEYLSGTHSKIDYARERLKNSQEILEKSHALLHIPKKCSYVVVESTDELTQVNKAHNKDSNLSEQRLKKISVCQNKNPLKLQITESDEDSCFEGINVNYKKELIEFDCEQSRKSVVEPVGSNLYNADENSDQGCYFHDLPEKCIARTKKKVPDKPSNGSCNIVPLPDHSLIENPIKKYSDSVSIDIYRDDSDIDMNIANIKCHNDGFEVESDVSNVTHPQNEAEIPVHQTSDDVATKKPNHEEQRSKFKQKSSSHSISELIFANPNDQQPLFAMTPSNVCKSVWDTLPNEMLLQIFSFLDQSDLKQVALVCHRFYSIAKENCLWSKLDVESTDITSSWLDNFIRVQQVNITRSKAKHLSNKSLREFFQNSKDTLKSIHLSHCSDKYLCGDNILLHIAAHCRKVSSVSLPWSNTTDNGIDALGTSNLMLKYLDISGNCFISDSSFINLLQKIGAIMETLKVNGCFALTQKSFVAIADNCKDLSVLEVGLCPKIGKESIILISSALKNLRQFDLRGLHAVDDYCLNCIAKNCKFLTKLVLANCKSLSDNGISNLGYDLPDLTYLDLSGCTNISDDGCCSLAHALSSPIHLDFSSTSISHVSVFSLTENFYHSLECFKVSFCNRITQDCVEKLISFCFKLNILHVHGCKRVDAKKLQKNHVTLAINK